MYTQVRFVIKWSLIYIKAYSVYINKRTLLLPVSLMYERKV